jgi:hypothetical protein
MDATVTAVELAEGKSATVLLHAALASAVTGFPEVFGDLDFPTDPSVFKASYSEILPEFEATRANSDSRTAIARAVVDAARTSMVMNPGAVPLADAVAQPTDPLPLESWSPHGPSRLQPRVPFGGRVLAGADLVSEVTRLVDRGSASRSVASAISWLVDTAGEGGIDLTGRRIVMLGAGAELAPTRLWLEAGAEVLWVDITDPPDELLDADELSGSLRWVRGGIDLLTDPHRVRATIEEFAGGEPIEVGLYAYAPGRAREWRLTATMNAIVDALPAGTVRSVALLLSPTTCGILTADDIEIEAARRADRPRWLGAFDSVRALGRGGGHVTRGSVAANRGVVSIQGGSYQAAQYVGKMLAAETWATADDPMLVSANTAGISLTESIHHPVFDIAFAGASTLGVETFDPSTTSALNGLLTLHDRIDPTVADRSIDELFSTRVHGGIYVTPYPIDPALRVAAAIGVVKDPRRVGALIRR